MTAVKATITRSTSAGAQEEEETFQKQANEGEVEKDVTVQLNTCIFFFFTGVTFDILF